MSSKEKCNTNYELVAPDGGWGYVIVLVGVINLITVTGFMTSFGIIYNEFMIEIGIGSTETSLLGGINAMSMAIGGFLTSPLLKLMTIRQLTLVNVIIYNVSTILMLFVKSDIPFYICVGALLGLSLGVIFNLTFAMVNEYFVQKRLFAYSILKIGYGIFVLFAPQLVKITLAEYGFRGTIFMISAVSLQSFVAVALIQPVAWHMKKVMKQPIEEETQVLLNDEKTGEFVLKIADPSVKSISKENMMHDKEATNRTTSWFTKLFYQIFDVPIMKQLILSNVSWGIAISGVSDLMFLMFIPKALYSYGWSKDNVALAISFLGLGDLVGRGCFAIFSKWLANISSQYIYIVGMIISVTARIGILCSSMVTMTLVFTALVGVGRCFMALFIPLVTSEVVSPEKFSAALGFIMLMMGLMNISCGPLIGAIQDYTHSYEITFWILVALHITSTVSWTIELQYKKRQRSNKENKS